MTEENILNMQHQINLGVDMENFSSQSAMILINGKPEPGTTEFPQSGFYINEEQSLDDSFTEQISQVYKHLNNLIIVANQHGTLFNQILKREKEQAKPNDVLDGIHEVGKMKEFKNNTFISHMNSAMENKENEATNNLISNSMKGVKSTLQGLCFANESIFDTTDSIAGQIKEINKKLSSLEDKKCDRVDEIDSKRELRTELVNVIENTADRLDNKMTTIDSEIDGKVNDTLQKLAEIQKETLWKIKDCDQMLKTRPTESFVNTSCEQIREGVDEKIKQFEENLKTTLENFSGNSKTNMFQATDSVAEQLKAKIIDLETKFELLNADKNTELKEFFMEKFDNQHVKFGDVENMIHSNQKKIEELLIMIKNVEKSTIKFESYEEETSTKFDMVSKTMHHLREDLQNIKFHFGGDSDNNSGGGGTDRKGPGGGGGSNRVNKDNSGGGTSNPLPVAPVLSNNMPRQEDPSGGFGFGVGGMGMTQEEKNNLRRCQDELEDYSRKFKDVYEKFGNLEEKIGSMNQAISMIQTELNYKLDKEQFDQALEYKLDKDEFYDKVNENSLDENSLKKLQHNVNKMTEKMEKMTNEIKGKVKKVKKKTEKVETKVDGMKFDLDELKEQVGPGGTNKESDGDQQMEGGKTVKEEVEGLNRALKRMFHMIKQLRNDHIKAIGTTRGLLCLSCGSKDVNFPPPKRYVKATDGNYYQTDTNILNTSKVNGNEFDYGKDVFTKEQIVKEEVLKRHIPVDMILGLDVDDMHMGGLLPKNNFTRPRTSANYPRMRRPGSANVTKSGTKYRKNLTKTTLQPIRVKNKSLIKSGDSEKKVVKVSKGGRAMSKSSLLKDDN